MRRYETIIIIDPDLSEEGRAPIFEKLDEIFAQEGGFVVTRDEWGVKKLAYPIKKKPRGNYVRLDYCGTGALVNEMERFFKIDDRNLKFMTIVLDKKPDIAGIKEEIAKAQAAVEASAQEQGADVAETPSEAAEAEAVEAEETETASKEEE